MLPSRGLVRPARYLKFPPGGGARLLLRPWAGGGVLPRPFCPLPGPQWCGLLRCVWCAGGRGRGVGSRPRRGPAPRPLGAPRPIRAGVPEPSIVCAPAPGAARVLAAGPLGVGARLPRLFIATSPPAVRSGRLGVGGPASVGGSGGRARCGGAGLPPHGLPVRPGLRALRASSRGIGRPCLLRPCRPAFAAGRRAPPSVGGARWPAWAPPWPAVSRLRSTGGGRARAAARAYGARCAPRREYGFVRAGSFAPFCPAFLPFLPQWARLVPRPPPAGAGGKRYTEGVEDGKNARRGRDRAGDTCRPPWAGSVRFQLRY